MSVVPRGARTARPSRTVVALLALLTALLALSGAASAGPKADRGSDRGSPVQACEKRNNNNVRKLLDCLTAAGAVRHLEAFQQIADANDGNRASGTPGYDASVDYVVDQLRRAGYDPVVHAFDFFYYEEESTVTRDGTELAPIDLATGEGDYYTMSYSGDGDVTTSSIVPALDVVVPIGDNPPNTSTSGCFEDSYAPAPDEPSIALVQRGECPFLTKALNAQAAGYDAVIVFNEGQEGRDGVVLGTLGEEAIGTLEIPVIGVSYADGADLVETYRAGGELPTIGIQVDVTAEERETYNVTADLEGRDPGNVVVVGAHLDSVVEGPGINDNGSGSAAILEVALKMGNNKPQNTVRFAWWGAEESGLIGSWEYVESLSEDELDAIALYLNFDMVASPNYVQFVYDGDQSTYEAPVPVPAGSAEIEGVFREFYDDRDLPSDDTEFSGRSDYQAFILNGIPAGGLFTGAEQVKTEEQAARYGGVAGLAYDPCYHQECDDLNPPNARPELQAAYGEALYGNVNLRALEQNVDAIGYAVLTFATSTALVDDAQPAAMAAAAASVASVAAEPGFPRTGHGPTLADR